jgi:[acyl-carrier-protein] S-malonyltransferase
MTLALLFPGQGSQHPGMGRELADVFPEARVVFEQADEILELPFRRMMWDGSELELTETRIAQPAILTHSVAVHRVVRQRLGSVAFLAGHSLGEFSAYVAAGTLSFEQALVAVRLRGELMFSAGEDRPGIMAAVLGLSESEVVDVCAGVEAGLCVPANFNAEGQVVISGEREAVSEGMERAKAAGARRVVELSVSGAFHSPLMRPAEEGLARRLETMDFLDPESPVISNVTAAPVNEGATARELLVKQLTSPVRWSASVATMVAARVDRFVELGPGTVLCGLSRRNAKGLPCVSIGAPADLDRLVEVMKGEGSEAPAREEGAE